VRRWTSGREHEIQSLTAAIGAGIGADFDLDKVRYASIVLPTPMSTAPHPHAPDHVLLRQMTPLWSGRLYVAQPPLLRRDRRQKVYVPDDAARLRVTRSTPIASCSSPFKGLANGFRTSCARRAWTRDAPPRAADVTDQDAIADERLATLMATTLTRAARDQHNAKTPLPDV